MTIERYRQARRVAFSRMGEVRERMDAWLDRYEQEVPAITALAELEGMHAERLRVVAELETAERVMIDVLLSARQDPSVLPG